MTALLYWGGPMLAMWFKPPQWLPLAMQVAGAVCMAVGAGSVLFAIREPKVEPTGVGTSTGHFYLHAARRTSLIEIRVNKDDRERALQEQLAAKGLALPVSEDQIIAYFQHLEGTDATPFLALNADVGTYVSNHHLQGLAVVGGNQSVWTTTGVVLVACSGILWLAPIFSVGMMVLWTMGHTRLRKAYATIIERKLTPYLQEAAANTRAAREKAGG